MIKLIPDNWESCVKSHCMQLLNTYIMLVQNGVWWDAYYFCFTAPADYTSVSDEPLTFTRDSPSQSVTISIRDDTTVEGSEKFVARLSVNAAFYPGVRLLPDTANINIIDNDGEILHNLCSSIKSCVYIHIFTLHSLHDWNCGILCTAVLKKTNTIWMSI